MSEVNDLVAGGYDPLQDHTASHDLHARLVRYGLRVDYIDDNGVYHYVEGTPGDRIGDLLWLYKDQPPPLNPFELSSPMPRDREIPAWAPIFPAIVTESKSKNPRIATGFGSGSLSRSTSFNPFVNERGQTPELEGPVNDPPYDGPVAPGSGKEQAEVTPLLELDQPDDRFAPMKVEGHGLSPGRRGVLVAGTHDGKQAPIFLAEAEPLIAVNANDKSERATLVYDLDGNLDADGRPDGKPDPTRFARLHSFLRVVRPKDDLAPEKVPLASGAKSHLLAWQLGRGGKDGLAGFGLVSDFPRPGLVSQGKKTGGTQSRSPLPGSMSISTGGISIKAGTGGQGLSIDGFGFQDGVPPGTRTTNPDAMTYAQAVDALGDLRYRGFDGEIKQVTYPDRMFTNAVENTTLYRIEIKGGPDGPFNDFTKEKGKPKPAVKLAVGAMSAFADGPIDAGGPGCPHELGVGWDGTHFYSAHLSVNTLFRSQAMDGPLTFEGALDRDPGPQPLRSRVHLVWNGSLSHDHVTGEKNGRWVWIAETMLYVVEKKEGTQERLLLDQGLGGGGDGTTGGGQGGGGVMCDPPSKTGGGQNRAYSASPFSQMFTGIFLRATDYTPGAKDTRFVQGLTDADLEGIDASPVVARLEAYGNRTGGDWSRANEANASQFPGGSSNGGLYFGPPEIDVKNTITNTVTDPVTPTTTGFIYHHDTSVGYGVPASNGTITNHEPFVSVPTGTPAGYVPVSTGVNGQEPTWSAPSGGGVPPVYGGGTDGTADFNGATDHNTFSTRNGGIYTLTRNVFLESGTIRTGCQIEAAGYAVFCRTTLTMEAFAGIVDSNEKYPNPFNEFDGQAGFAGAEYLGGGGGGNGARTLNAVAGTSVTDSLGGAGGAGGAGTTWAAAAGGTVTEPPNPDALEILANAAIGAIFSGGAWVQVAGGAGGGGGGSTGTQKGGRGGVGGGFLLVCAADLVMAAGAYIYAYGSDGGSPTVDGGTGSGSGGGGGGGGVTVAVYQTKTGAGTITSPGGAGGLGQGVRPNGTDGTAGTVIELTGS